VKDITTVAEFYQTHFGYSPLPGSSSGWLELQGIGGGCNLALHQAAKTQKSGASIKIVFGVKDVAAFTEERKPAGLEFGPIHHAEGHAFANAKDPAGNSISISSRGMGTR
jgi:predicted enzyme related to lactoylglutathione lyase